MNETIQRGDHFYIHLWFDAPHGPLESIEGFGQQYATPPAKGSFVRSLLFPSSFIHSFIYSFIYSFIHSFIYSFSQSVHSFIQSINQSIMHSINPAFIQSIIHSINQSYIQMPLFSCGAQAAMGRRTRILTLRAMEGLQIRLYGLQHGRKHRSYS